MGSRTNAGNDTSVSFQVFLNDFDDGLFTLSPKSVFHGLRSGIPLQDKRISPEKTWAEGQERYSFTAAL